MPTFAEKFMGAMPRGDSTRTRRQASPPDARWMEVAEILENKAIAYDPAKPGSKILIGALDGRLIGIDDERHILTVAGSRSGKSVGAIGNLLCYRGSALITDPKGEIAEATAQRRAAMGQAVYVLDPFGRTKEAAEFRCSYNPLSVLTLDSPTLLEDAAQIADAIVIQEPREEPHWNESAKNYIEGLIVHVATAKAYENRRNLVTVRQLIKKVLLTTENLEPQPADSKKKAVPLLYIELLKNAESLSKNVATSDFGAALEGAAHDFYNKSGDELHSVLSTINRQTKFLDYPSFRDVLQGNDLDLKDLKRKLKGMSVYLCFPPTRASMSKRWMRIFVNQFLEAMSGDLPYPKAPVLGVFDEFPVLGYMKQLEDAVGTMAGYGVKLHFILQDWNQGATLYGDRWESFVGNSGILQFFGNTDITTTEYISRLLGKTRIEVTRKQEVDQSSKDGNVMGRSEVSELYDLLAPEEVTRMFSIRDPYKRQLVVWPGFHPMVLQKVEYFDQNGAVGLFLSKER